MTSPPVPLLALRTKKKKKKDRAAQFRARQGPLSTSASTGSDTLSHSRSVPPTKRAPLRPTTSREHRGSSPRSKNDLHPRFSSAPPLLPSIRRACHFSSSDPRSAARPGRAALVQPSTNRSGPVKPRIQPAHSAGLRTVFLTADISGHRVENESEQFALVADWFISVRSQQWQARRAA